VVINFDLLKPFIIFNKPIPIGGILLYPVKMSDVLSFNGLINSITIRKESIFPEKRILKMSYLEFLVFCKDNEEFATQYKKEWLIGCCMDMLHLMQLVCQTNDVSINLKTNVLYINGQQISSDVFDNIRRIIFIQNDYDFNIDEFMNLETLTALENAKTFEANKVKEKSDIEDYIDSLVIGLKMTKTEIEQLTIREFWRYIKRLNKHEDYLAAISGQMSGMVSFKEPIRHWMASFDVEDKYSNVKTDESALKDKMG
jgi:hypothetical protein